MAKTTPSAAPKAAPAGATQPGIRVRSCSPQDTFHRAGLAFGRAPTDHALADLKLDQVKRIRAEPMLVVEDIEMPVAQPAEQEADT